MQRRKFEAGAGHEDHARGNPRNVRLYLDGAIKPKLKP
jgi:hypothetical protein